jgi:hypothetical protein
LFCEQPKSPQAAAAPTHHRIHRFVLMAQSSSPQLE